MEKYGITPQVYHFNSLMDIHLKSRNHNEIFDLFLEIRRLGYRSDRSTYNLVLTAYVRERREIDALAIFEDMMMKHVRPDRNTFALLMRLYSSAEDVEKCRSWFQRMIKDGVAPGEINYALLIEAFLRAGLVEDAKVAAHEVEAKDILPRTRLSTCLMRLALVWKDRMRARKMAEDLWLNRKDWRFELADVENIIQILSHANENEIVLKFEQFLFERGWEPSVRTRRIVNRIRHPDLMRNDTQNEQSAAFVEMIDRFARASDLIRSKRAFNRMLEEGVNPTTEVYNAMIRAYCFCGEIGMALRTLGELRTSLFLEPDALSYKPIVLALVREKQLDKANH
uniref:Pentacotripeptide-repeat region of PRORP domain-containing protein n=1 Tax=Rhodosorus marinus TaxID=101924 RepID=A0A7S0BJ53_9RHOD